MYTAYTKKMNKKIILTFLILGVFLILPISACGWFTYEDFPETRTYYNYQDILVGIEDSVLSMSRFPNQQEIKMNVYIPMNTLN